MGRTFVRVVRVVRLVRSGFYNYVIIADRHGELFKGRRGVIHERTMSYEMFLNEGYRMYYR